MAREQCYMCEKPATSREHVPPKCLFPEAKDIPGEDYRKGLLTVPSCDEHNGCKAKDDEFLLLNLAGIIGNNVVGFQQHLTKVGRAIVKSSGRLLNTVYTDLKHFSLKLDDGIEIPVMIGKPDIPRLERCFEKIAFGLYRHHFNETFRGKAKIVLGNLIHDEKNPAAFWNLLKTKAEIDLRDVPLNGTNPAVFSYQFSDADEFKLRLLRLQFYEGMEVFVSLIPEGTTLPFNLSMKLIEEGVKSYIRVGEKVFEFN